VFVVNLTYTAPQDQIDTRADAHASWLDQQYKESGTFRGSYAATS
jgi:uncharacterized protein YciI